VDETPVKKTAGGRAVLISLTSRCREPPPTDRCAACLHKPPVEPIGVSPAGERVGAAPAMIELLLLLLLLLLLDAVGRCRHRFNLANPMPTCKHPIMQGSRTPLRTEPSDTNISMASSGGQPPMPPSEAVAAAQRQVMEAAEARLAAAMQERIDAAVAAALTRSGAAVRTHPAEGGAPLLQSRLSEAIAKAEAAEAAARALRAEATARDEATDRRLRELERAVLQRQQPQQQQPTGFSSDGALTPSKTKVDAFGERLSALASRYGAGACDDGRAAPAERAASSPLPAAERPVAAAAAAAAELESAASLGSRLAAVEAAVRRMSRRDSLADCEPHTPVAAEASEATLLEKQASASRVAAARGPSPGGKAAAASPSGKPPSPSPGRPRTSAGGVTGTGLAALRLQLDLVSRRVDGLQKLMQEEQAQTPPRPSAAPGKGGAMLSAQQLAVKTLQAAGAESAARLDALAADVAAARAAAGDGAAAAEAAAANASVASSRSDQAVQATKELGSLLAAVEARVCALESGAAGATPQQAAAATPAAAGSAVAGTPSTHPCRPSVAPRSALSGAGRPSRGSVDALDSPSFVQHRLGALSYTAAGAGAAGASAGSEASEAAARARPTISKLRNAFDNRLFATEEQHGESSPAASGVAAAAEEEEEEARRQEGEEEEVSSKAGKPPAGTAAATEAATEEEAAGLLQWKLKGVDHLTENSPSPENGDALIPAFRGEAGDSNDDDGPQSARSASPAAANRRGAAAKPPAASASPAARSPGDSLGAPAPLRKTPPAEGRRPSGLEIAKEVMARAAEDSPGRVRRQATALETAIAVISTDSTETASPTKRSAGAVKGAAGALLQPRERGGGSPVSTPGVGRGKGAASEIHLSPRTLGVGKLSPRVPSPLLGLIPLEESGAWSDDLMLQ
jgi:hypothetical protein